MPDAANREQNSRIDSCIGFSPSGDSETNSSGSDTGSEEPIILTDGGVCTLCGRPKRGGRMCKKCARDEGRQSPAEMEIELYECPSCGEERSSGSGVVCVECRRDS